MCRDLRRCRCVRGVFSSARHMCSPSPSARSSSLHVRSQSLEMTVSEFKQRILGVKKPVVLTCPIEDVRIDFGGKLSAMRKYQVH